LVPIHGELRHLKAHGKLAETMGIPRQNISVVENGTVLELDEQSLTVGPRIPGGYVFVDGAGVGDVGPAVMRDRERLAESGFFVAVVQVNQRGQIVGRPDILSRGFVYLEESSALLEGAEEVIAQVVHTSSGDKAEIGKKLEGALSKYLYAETGRRPMTYAIIK
jgi:ribonuclease J